jgi:hypothetical protein
MRGSCQKTEAVARLETLYLQRQLPELQKKTSVHFSRLSGIMPTTLLLQPPLPRIFRPSYCPALLKETVTE